MTDVAGLRRVLESKPLERLLGRLVQRLDRGQPLVGMLTLQGPSDDEREAVDRLLGRPPSRGDSLAVNLDKLNAIIRHAGLAPGLREAVEAVYGKRTDQRRARRAEQTKWDEMWASARSRLADRPALLAWVDSIRRDGTLRRLVAGKTEAGHAMLGMAIDVLQELPAEGRLLAELAACVCGDSHALDTGSPVSALVLRALACVRGEDTPVAPKDRRDLWDRFGVACDDLSAPVLVLNLRIRGISCLARALSVHAEAGEPYRISTRQMLKDGSEVEHGTETQTAYVCENVNVVAAAAQRYGPTCPPMVCIDGNPKTAARMLLDRLRNGGVCLRYHGDFDWAGVAIANLVHKRHGAIPWRMTPEDYEAYASRGTSLAGQPIAAMWDSRLTEVMQRRQRAVHEELTIETLLGDLSADERLQAE